MDIFSHGLWAGAVYKIAKMKTKQPLKIKWAVFWGLFPDFFAFTIIFIWMAGGLIFRTIQPADLPQPDEFEPVGQIDMEEIERGQQHGPLADLTKELYNISHSMIIFFVIFGLVYFIKRRPVWELTGWLFHILVDIPTHSYQFYPTPFLWPVSDWKFNGFSWEMLWFMIPNYLTIIAVYIFLKIRKDKKIESKQ
jgi:hypothetical protein